MSTARLRQFIVRFTRLVDRESEEAAIVAQGAELLCELIATDDWLADEFARHDASRYQQYLLHCDPLERFSIVSFAWAPGQRTPIHDHTVWGLVGVLRGQETSERFTPAATGGLVPCGTAVLAPGAVEVLSPQLGDIHRVTSTAEESTVSIHVYGANIGRTGRHSFDLSGRRESFVSGYSNATLPNIWI